MQFFIILNKMFSEQIIIPTFHISFKVYSKASSKHKLIIIQFTDPLLCKISSSKNCGYIKFDITSKYCTNALFINVNVQKLFDAEFMSLHTLKFLPIIPVCVITISHFLVPKYIYIRSIIPQNVVLAHQFSEFSVLTHNIPKMMISEQKIAKSNVMFLEHTVVVTCLY